MFVGWQDCPVHVSLLSVKCNVLRFPKGWCTSDYDWQYVPLIRWFKAIKQPPVGWCRSVEMAGERAAPLDLPADLLHGPQLDAPFTEEEVPPATTHYSKSRRCHGTFFQCTVRNTGWHELGNHVILQGRTSLDMGNRHLTNIDKISGLGQSHILRLASAFWWCSTYLYWSMF